MSSDFFKIYSGRYLDLNKVEKDFLNFYKNNFESYNVNNDYLREIEFTLNFPHVNIFTMLYNVEKSNRSSYLEIKYVIDESRKIRLRKKLNENFISYTKNKEEILNLIKNETWNEKKIDIIEKENELYSFKSSKEYLSRYNFNSVDKKRIKYCFVNSIFVENVLFRAEVRLKTLLKNNNDNLIMHYFDPSNFFRTLSFEIEVKKTKDIIGDQEFIKKFNHLLRISLGINKERIYLIYDDVYVKLRTHMENIYNVLNLDTKNIFITKKIDGEFVQFYIKNGICYFVKNYLLIDFTSNVNKDYEIIGSGEYIILDKERKLFPFHLEEVKKKGKEVLFKSRIESLSFLKSILLDTKNELEIISKDLYGPFEDRNDFFRTILEVSNKVSLIPCDGLIISENDKLLSKDIKDLKLKKNNSIDTYTSYVLTNDENINELNFNIYIYREGKSLLKLFSVNTNSSEKFSYDYNLSMLVYNDNNIKRIIPNNFISEYFIDRNSFIPRFDKIQKLLVSERKTRYTGNSVVVIIDSIVIHENKLYFTPEFFQNMIDKDDEEISKMIEDFKQLFLKYREDKIKKIFNINSPKKDKEETQLIEYNPNEYVIEPLNLNKTWYKKDTYLVERSDLNVACNLNKTLGLLNSINPISSPNTYQSLISIYCGKGGDIGKMINNNIKEVVGIDPDQSALDIFQERRKNSFKDKSKIFNLKTIAMCLEQKNFLSELYKKIGLNVTFDVIDIQLGLHFSYTEETKDHVCNILESLANKKTKPKTRLLISCNDKDNIYSLFKKYKATDVLKLKINDKVNYEINLINEKKISIFYDSSMNEPMEEYLISKEDLITTLKKYNFNLIQSWTFDETLNDESVYKNLELKYKRTSSKNFLTKISNINFEDNNLKDILSIFRYYVFEY